MPNESITLAVAFLPSAQSIPTRLKLLCRLARALRIVLMVPRTDPERFGGWYWTGARWEKTCSHDQAAECWQTLAATAPAGSRLAVLPKEIDPNQESQWRTPNTSQSTSMRCCGRRKWSFLWPSRGRRTE